MHYATSLLASAAVCIVTAIAQTVHLAGDSTMVATGNDMGHDGTAGWGKFLPDYISLKVDNQAVAGRSARSFTNEGRFSAMAQNTRPGDYVVMEFGHNDAHSMADADGRAPCRPTQAEGYAATCKAVFNGKTVTVFTFYKYMVDAAKLFQSKGAKVIISSATPNNLWEGGVYAYTPSEFVGYARDVAKDTGSTFIDHQLYTAELYKQLGSVIVNSYYPHDHTHTSPAGANTVAKAFVLGLKASDSGLKQFITHA